jgi:pimeloyl-ACP methyl ester carboxylesterase
MTTPVVLVPGLGLGPESYAPTVEHLTAPYEVVTLPGYGEPAEPGEDLRPGALGVRLASRLTARSVLVGHSASCQIVVETAVACPELVHAVVLVGPTGNTETSSWPELTARLVKSAVWEPPEIMPVVVQQYARTTFSSIARAADAARRHDLAEVIVRMKAPLLVLRSEHDRLSPPEWTQRLAELAHGEVRTLATGAHLPVLTNGRELAALIQRAAAVGTTG